MSERADETTIVRANEENLFAQYRTFAATAGEFHEESGFTWFVTGTAAALNGVIETRLSEADASAQIDALLTVVRRRRLRMLWWVGPASTPENLSDLLLARLPRLAQLSGVAANLSQLPSETPAPERVVIEEVRDAQDAQALEAWGEAYSAAWESPNAGDSWVQCYRRAGLAAAEPCYRHHIARINGRPVGCGTTWYSGGVAGMYRLAIAPEFRRRGIGHALLLRRLHDARRSGYHYAIAQCTQAGLKLYASMGFGRICEFECFGVY